MTQEEKLEEAKRLYETANADQKYVLEMLFPELAESEDERIRKGLIEACKQSLIVGGFHKDKVIAWLEKQGEKDKEILVLKDQIESLHAAIKALKETHKIELEKQGEHQEYPKDVIDNAISFLANRNDGMPKEEAKDIVNAIITILNPSCWPKQGEQKSVDKVDHKFKVGDIIRLKGSAAEYTIKKVTDTTYYTNGWSCSIERCEEDYELVEQKPAWSEEDKYLLDETIKHLEALIRITKKQGSAYSDEIQYYQRDIDWLKSLRPQSTWKPSDEMLEALYRVIPENVMEKSEDEILLDKLYQGLKYGKVLSEK